MFTKNVAAVLVVQAMFFGVAALGQTVNPLRVIADTDTLVPGGAGQTFQTFFQLDGVDPDISGRNVVFQACCPTGIYSWLNGELSTVVDLNTTFPESGKLLGFVTGSSPSVSGNNVAFFCTHGRPGPGALCAVVDGRLELLAEFGVTIVPGTNETFRFFLGTSPSISGKNVAFPAASASGNGIYARIDGQLVIIADSTTPVPGQPGLVFKNFGQLGGSSPSISGRNVAFVGMWSGGSGIYASVNGILEVVAASPTTGVSASGGPSISGANVAFLGDGGVLARINGELRVLANTSTPAPGASGNFVQFGQLDDLSPGISGENVAFGGLAFGLGYGVWTHIDGTLDLLAGGNTVVPNHAPTTFDSFGTGVSPAVSEDNVVFFGSATMPEDHHVFGIYARIIDPPIPAASTWGIAAFALVAVGLGAGLIVRRRSIHEQ